MGDYFHAIADRDVSLADAPAAAKRVRDWLVAEQIILPDLYERVAISGDGRGYLPGPLVSTDPSIDS